MLVIFYTITIKHSPQLSIYFLKHWFKCHGSRSEGAKRQERHLLPMDKNVHVA